MPNIDGEPTFAEWLEESNFRLSDAMTDFFGIKHWPKQEGALRGKIAEGFCKFINAWDEKKNIEPFEVVVEFLAKENSETYGDYLEYIDDLRAESENDERDLRHQTAPETRNGGLL